MGYSVLQILHLGSALTMSLLTPQAGVIPPQSATQGPAGSNIAEFS